MSLPNALTETIERAGYFPSVALAAVRRAIGGGAVHAFLVRPETSFDGPEVRRHLTVLVLGDNHLFITHLDDEIADALNPTQVVVASERIKLSRIHNVALSQVYDTDGAHVAATQSEITVGLSWGSHRRIELERAWCDDPNCQADHGFTGSSQSADLVVRVSSLADGATAVEEALAFFDALNAATL